LALIVKITKDKITEGNMIHKGRVSTLVTYAFLYEYDLLLN